jgi:hypothetical protein
MTPIDWTVEPAHPGDMIGATALRRADDIGLVCVQHYGSILRVATFLPGREIFLPGDTPKVEPERYVMLSTDDRVGAERQYSAYLRDAQDAGWVIPLSTGAACESIS